MPEESCEHDL